MTSSLSVYFDKRNLRVFGLGISSGLPWVLIGSMLSLWLKESGLSRSAIGYAGAIFAVYAINFLWSPIIDRVRLPLIGRLGQRRSWILLMQLSISLLCIAVSVTNPINQANITILLCLFIAIASATQDVAIDAYRIDTIPEADKPMLAAGAAMATSGWWTGYAGIGFFPLWLSDHYLAWPHIYAAMALVPLLLALLTLLSPEPAPQQRLKAQREIEAHYLSGITQIDLHRKLGLLATLMLPVALCIWIFSGFTGLPQSQWNTLIAMTAGAILVIGIAYQLARLDQLSSHHNHTINKHGAGALDRGLSWLLVSLAQPIKDFFSRIELRAAVSILLFILLFKIGESFLGRMSIVFYKEIGFSNADIGYFSKLMSWWVTIVFSLIGGWFTLKQGLLKGLIVGGIAMASTNLLFALMAMVGPNKALFGLTILLDGFTSAWSTVAFVAFISALCSRTFTATQYALLASLGNLGRTLLSSSSGQLVDALNGNWPLFFCLTALMIIPALSLLFWAKKDIAVFQQ